MYQYIYSSNSKILHDSKCRYTSHILENHMKKSSSWFLFRKNAMNFCKCCGYQAVLRENARVSDEELDACTTLLKKNGVELEYLIKYFRYYKGTMRYKHNVFYLQVGEDQWILDAGRGKITLLHNNYLYNKETNERYFNGGFHVQNLRENTFKCAFETVQHYRFRCHEQENEMPIIAIGAFVNAKENSMVARA